MRARRVVTGRNADVRSHVSSDAPCPHVNLLDDYPGVEIERLWSTDQPSCLDGPAAEPAADVGDRYPPPGGSRFLRITYPPGFGSAAPDADSSRFERLLMHRSATLDFGVVVQGELTLVLGDGSQTRLAAGDVLVQNAVEHGWRNTGLEPAVAVFVLMGCQK